VSAEADRVGVIGAGQMGSGIAQVVAQAGLEVWLHDTPEALKRSKASMEDSLGRLSARGRLQEAPGAVLERVHPAAELEDLAGVRTLLEAVTEDWGVKSGIFARLRELLSEDALVATNTSSIPITQLASSYGRPGRFLGLHFMNPVPVMPLVEVIRGLGTAEEAVAQALDLVGRLGKTAVQCNDYPGFVSNRILMPMLNEAIQCVMEGVAEPEAIDQIMRLGMNHPMGPLALADFIGLDTCLAILEVLHSGLGDPKYRPSPLLRKMVAAGWLGRKSGRGFYRY
jgi:3-hydroxybutyryl-CoA dehydrogenase